VDKALDVAGGAGFYRSVQLERHFRDIQAGRYHPCQEKAQLYLSGRLALGFGIDG
jgi:acyl-CoA dehydrogenase